ncbi:MAG: DUF1854 domain-containing protein [bacterium]
MQVNELTIYRRNDGRLGVKSVDDNGEATDTPVKAVRCFPWSLPDRYISIVDKKNNELFLIENLESLADEQTKQLLRNEISERTYLPQILQIRTIDDEIDLFKWHVQTNAGERVFFTRRREIPREVAGGQVVLRDISGDRYVIENIDALDEKSRNWLWLYLD